MSKIRTLFLNAGLAMGVICAPALVSAATVLPMIGAEMPTTRDAVEREAIRAMRAGEIPQGERYGKHLDQPARTVASSTLNRGDVEREAVRAMRAGELPRGELFGQRMAPPIQSTIGTGVSRADVEREAIRAMRAGEIPRGELYKPSQGW